MSEEKGKYKVKKENEKLESSVVTLLDAVWRAIDFDKWNRRKIWGIFERKVKSCANQNIYPKAFFQQLCTKMRVPTASGIDISSILQENNRKVINYVRENTGLCVMLLRVQRQEIREATEKSTTRL